MNAIERRYMSLVEKLKEGERKYDAGSPVYTDAAYDALYKEVLNLEKKHPDLAAKYGSVDSKVVLVTPYGCSVVHVPPMLSLDKVYDIKDLEDWHYRNVGKIRTAIRYGLDFKRDGIAIELKYRDGVLICISTRGTGVVGEDITYSRNRFRNLIDTISIKDDVLVRGEAMLSQELFDLLNADLADADKYSNSRNAVAGILRSINWHKDACIDFLGYRLLDGNCKSLSQEYAALESLGYALDLSFNIATSIEETIQSIDVYKDHQLRSQYASDGVVITIDDNDDRESMGSTAKFPNGAIAFKWANVSAQSKLNSVIWQVGRTGVVTPVGIIDKTTIGGVEIDRVNLYNRDEIARLGLMLGSEVEVARAGSVIPKIIAATAGLTAIPDITNCPACDSILSGTKLLKCTNARCSEINIRKIEYFLSRDGLNVKGFAYASIKQLYDTGAIRTIADVFDIASRAIIIDLSLMPLISRLDRAMELVKSVNFKDFFVALGIEDCSKGTAITLESSGFRFESITNGDIYTAEDFRTKFGVPPVSSAFLHAFFSDLVNVSILRRILGYITIKYADSASTGELWAFSGEFNMLNRKEATALLNRKGAIVTDRITKNLHTLVSGNNPSSKLNKAKGFSVRIITEEEFIKETGY